MEILAIANTDRANADSQNNGWNFFSSVHLQESKKHLHLNLLTPKVLKQSS